MLRKVPDGTIAMVFDFSHLLFEDGGVPAVLGFLAGDDATDATLIHCL